jgi:hypothetical protein
MYVGLFEESDRKININSQEKKIGNGNCLFVEELQLSNLEINHRAFSIGYSLSFARIVSSKISES